MSKTIKPLAWIVRRFPAAFGMEWTTDETWIRTGPSTYDTRPIRVLSAGWVPDGWEYVGDEWPENVPVRADHA